MSIKDKIINFIKINGITHQVSGDHVEVKENKVFVDNKEVSKITENHIDIEWKGELATLSVSTGDVKCENVGGDVYAEEGNINCGNVDGFADAGGNITCGDVGGKVEAGGDIICKDVKGSVSTDEGNITA